MKSLFVITVTALASFSLGAASGLMLSNTSPRRTVSSTQAHATIVINWGEGSEASMKVD